MKGINLAAGLSLLLCALVARAELEPWKDYDIGESLLNITTVKVDSNMIDKYLEGLKATWMTGNETAKALGQIKGYTIFVSELAASGNFNVVLVVEMNNAADLQPSQEKYKAFMKRWGEDNKKTTDKIVQTYPDIREITGEYLMREITLK